MNKTVLTLLFFFGAIIGGYFYLDNTHFFEINTCLSAEGDWNYEENTCKTQTDIDLCTEKNGIWIDEESTCDFGEIIN